ncbi:tautomerase family protein [Nocardia tengchongensis]|uniref:tautomerase family protein n=1 Tax=Nocardia tengchongensis TaxID=2055889 RepID=UPI0036C8FCF6
MAQVKIYAHKDFLDTGTTRADISQSIHGAVMAALDYPAEKKVHRFFPMVAEDFVHMADRGGTYTIIEISLFEGRSIQARKQLIRELFTRLAASPGIEPHSVEITLTETPRENWGIRGLPGDELTLDYQVDI